MIAIQVRGLGASEIRVGDTRITLSQERVFKTLFYLAVRAGERVPRTDLVATLWGGEVLARGRQSLRQMLYRLRQMGVPLDESGETVRLDPTDVRCDVAEALRDGWAATASVDEVWAAADLLPGTSHRTTPGFEEWLDSLRARVASQFRRAALRHVAEARRSARWRDVEELALRVLHSDPLNEEATLARAEALAMQGSKAMALDVLDAYAKELGERNDRIGLPAATMRRRIVSSDASIKEDERGINPRLPLLEQSDAIKELYPVAKQAPDSDGAVYVLTGAGGAGKTRISQEMAALAQLNGIQVITCRNDKAEGAAPLGLYSQLLQKLLTAPGSAGTAPDALDHLRRLTSPETLGTGEHSPEHARALAGLATHATKELLTSIGEEQRSLVWVEDIHNADAASLALVQQIIGQSYRTRVRWLLTTRHDGKTVRSQLSAIAPTRLVIRHVAPLQREAATALAMKVVEQDGGAMQPTDATAIALHAGGNPLFTILLAKALRSGSVNGTLHLDPDLDLIIARRLESLNEACTHVLSSIAMLGTACSPARVRDATTLSHTAFTSALATLEHEGVISVDSDGALLFHECWRQVFERRLVGTARVALSLAHAEYLDTLATDGDVALRWRAALLYRHAGEFSRAAPLFLAVGLFLLARGELTSATEAFLESIACLPDKHGEQAARLYCARSQFALGDMESAYSSALLGLRITCDGSVRSVDHRLFLKALALDSAWRLGQPFHALLTELVTDLEDRRASGEAIGYAAFISMRVAFNDGADALTLHLAMDTLRAAKKLGDNEYGLLAQLVYAAEREPASAIREINSRLEALPREGVSIGLQAMSLRYQAQALRWGGLYEDALRTTALCQSLTSAIGLRDETALLALQSGFLCLDLQRIDEAREWYDICLRESGHNPAHERTIALAQLRARLLLALDKSREAAEVLLPLLPFISDDNLTKRKCAGAAALALALTETPHDGLCLQMIETARAIVLREAPSLQLDFPCEATCQALQALGRRDEAKSLMNDYAARRRAHFARPVAPAFSLLRSALTEQPL